MKAQKPKPPFTGEITIYDVIRYAYNNLIYAVFFFVIFAIVGYGLGDTRQTKYQVTANVRMGLQENGKLQYKIAILYSFFRQMEVHAQRIGSGFYPNIRYGDARITSQEIILIGEDKNQALSDMITLLRRVEKTLYGLEEGLFRNMKISDTRGKKIFFATESVAVTPYKKGRSAEYNAIVLGAIGSVMGWGCATPIGRLRKRKKISTS